MTETMTQRGVGLFAPTSRQDIVSQLLSAYANSFGQGNPSPSRLSPVPADKELPPPPPRSDSLARKPLPAYERAEERMTAKFPLRTHEDIPASPNGTRTRPSGQPPRKRIQYRSLSREVKPPSLTLTISNGSTATLPPTPALSERAKFLGLTPLPPTKDLPSPPPPPPEKSDRRPIVQTKAQKDLVRNDSLISQGETEPPQGDSAPVVTVTPVKRKDLAAPAEKKFVTLAALGNRPRGGKGGPMPAPSTPRKASVDSEMIHDNEPKIQSREASRERPALNTQAPMSEAKQLVAPVPPRKAFVPMGLPSNPRAKGGPISPNHTRGKSSTSFNILKAQRPAPPIPTMKIEMLTPELTPSPISKYDVGKHQDPISPVSLLPPPSDGQRPFSYEELKRPEPQAKPKTRALDTVAPMVSPLAPTTLTQSGLPTRTPSLEEASSNTSQSSKAVAPAYVLEGFTSRTSTTPSDTPEQSITPSQSTTPPPPFTPLTRAPMPLPARLIPEITATHLKCYANHRMNIWSNNMFQPMGCMVCHSNEKDRKWACTWCQLRLCKACSETLCALPGRDLWVLMERRVKEGASPRERV